MKRIIFYVFFICAIFLTGCSSSNEKTNDEKVPFTIKCNGEIMDYGSYEIQNLYEYNFNKEQYVTSYSTISNQKFNDESVYNEFKTSQEETVKNITEDISYDLKSNDEDKSLVFTMTVKNIDLNNATTKEEKDKLKASSILKSNEEITSEKRTCVVEGIDRKNIK